VFADELAVAGEVVLFQCGRAQGTFRVEKSRELGDQAVSLESNVRDGVPLPCITSSYLFQQPLDLDLGPLFVFGWLGREVGGRGILGVRVE
jgi:hypothetical protein